MRSTLVSLSCELREVTLALEATCELWEALAAPGDKQARGALGLRALVRLVAERLRLVGRATEGEVDPRLLAAPHNQAEPDGASPDLVLESWPLGRSGAGRTAAPRRRQLRRAKQRGG